MEYLLLDPSKNEIRVLILKDPPETSSSSGLIECTLEHVSLDDYSDQYTAFFKPDGSNKPFRFQSTLWEVVTIWEADFENDSSFNSASVYNWGDPTATANILPNGHWVTVTKKLRETLQDLLGGTEKLRRLSQRDCGSTHYTSTRRMSWLGSRGLLELRYGRYQGYGKANHYLPCWVPDWTSPAEDGFYELFFAVDYYKATNSNTSADCSHTFIEPGSPDNLVCRRFKVDSIASLACSVRRDRNDHDTIIGMHDSDKPVYSGREEVKGTMWEVFTYGQYKKMGLAIVSRIVTRPIEKTPDDPALFDAFSTTMFPLICRRFVTRKGFMGMVPRSVKADDQVFILRGSNVPLILRPKDDNTYRLVGESYISGLMNGEAMKGLEAGGYKE